jgi:hypothetical protein
MFSSRLIVDCEHSAAPLSGAWPTAVRFFYLLVKESHDIFAGVVQAAVDGFRLDLLTALHLPRPRSLSAERELWRLLAQTHVPGGTVDYPLRYGQK